MKEVITIASNGAGLSEIKNVSKDQIVIFGGGFDGERYILPPGEVLMTVSNTLVFHITKAIPKEEQTDA